MLMDIFQQAAQYAPYVVGALAALALPFSFYTNKQEHHTLVTRFDGHNRTAVEPGLKMKIPLIEKAIPVSLQEFQEESHLETKTTDDLFVKLPIAIHYQVSDPATYIFKKGNAVKLMDKAVAGAVREYTSKKTFQELYDERQQIRDGVIEKVKEKVADLGIQINDIIIDEPQASDEVKSTFDKVRSSELEKEVATNEAEADYTRRVRAADADKERNIRIGEGVAGFREKIASGYSSLRKQLIADGVNPEAADRFMEEAMRLDTLRDIGDKGNMVIVTPDSASGQRIGELQALSTTLGKAAANDTPESPTTKPVPEQDVSPGGEEEPVVAASGGGAPKPGM